MIDFEYMANLAMTDPAEFEIQRKALLEAEINKGSELQRARGRKMLAEFEERALKSGERMETAASMMTDNLNRLQQQLTKLTTND